MEIINVESKILFSRHNQKYGYRVHKSHIRVAIQYHNGFLIQIRGADGTDFCLTSIEKVVNKSDLIITRVQEEMPINVPFTTANQVCPINIDVFQQKQFDLIRSKTHNTEIFELMQIIRMYNKQIVEAVAKDVSRMQSNLVDAKIFPMLFFKGNMLDICTNPDLMILNELWQLDFDCLLYFESQILFKVITAACGVFVSYQQGYCEIANTVVQLSFFKALNDEQQNLEQFITETADVLYSVLILAQRVIDPFLAADTEVVRLNQQLRAELELLDPDLTTVLYEDERRGGIPFIYGVMQMTAGLFTRVVKGDYLLELWTQVFEEPKPITIIKLVAQILSQCQDQICGGKSPKELVKELEKGEDVLYILQRVQTIELRW